MSDVMVVGISDYKLARNPNVFVTYALGSCVGICLYDQLLKIGGLSHIMLPESSMFNKADINRMKFADTAIVRLIKEMEKLGANSGKIIAKLAGGAQMFAFTQSSDMMRIGLRNVLSSKEKLRELHIPVISEDTGGSYGRTIELNSTSGKLLIKTIGYGIKEI
jgi:chemotaxis protein CheD